jgi:hypothetical protein
MSPIAREDMTTALDVKKVFLLSLDRKREIIISRKESEDFRGCAYAASSTAEREL